MDVLTRLQRRGAKGPMLVFVGVVLLVSSLLFARLALRPALSVFHMELVESSAIDSADSYDPRLFVEEDRERFRAELMPLIVGKSGEERVKIIQSWVMNQVSAVGGVYDRSAWSMVESARSGEGLLCGGMSTVLRDALLSVDIPARRVLLFRDRFMSGRDTHVTVEAWVDGAWRVFDPTFNVVLVRDGELIGARQAREWIQSIADDGPDILFLGPVKYPARINEYYISIQMLFDHVYYEVGIPTSRGVWLPLYGPLVDGVYYADGSAQLVDLTGDVLHRNLYWTVLVILPGIGVISILCGLIAHFWVIAEAFAKPGFDEQ